MVTVVAQVAKPANMDWLDDYWCDVCAEIVGIHDQTGRELILDVDMEEALLEQAIAKFYNAKAEKEETLAAIQEDQMEAPPIAESTLYSLIKTDTNAITSQCT